MANKIIFGADLIDVLENKYNMNQLANVPTKYKNGVTTIDFIYGKEKDIDDLKYNKPYVEFSIDDETDGFISGTMYLNGGVEGIQFDSWDDLKYFMKNAKWIESRKSMKENSILYVIKSKDGFQYIGKKIFDVCENIKDAKKFKSEFEAEQFLNKHGKSLDFRYWKVIGVDSSVFEESRKSLKEGIDVKIVYADDTPSEYIDDVTRSDILDIIEESPEVYKIFDVSGSKKKLVWSDEYGFERAYESKKSARKSMKESLNSDIKLMVNRIVDDLIAEYTPKEWDSLSANEKFDIIRIKYFTYEGKSKYLSKVRDLVIENMNHPFDIVFESNKSAKKFLKESVDGYIATDEDCNMSGKGWVLDGSYNFIMDFLQEWGIAPKDVKVKNGMTTLYNADGNPFGYVYQDEEVDIFVADKTTNWTWENHNPSTKRVKVTALDEIF